MATFGHRWDYYYILSFYTPIKLRNSFGPPWSPVRKQFQFFAQNSIFLLFLGPKIKSRSTPRMPFSSWQLNTTSNPKQFRTFPGSDSLIQNNLFQFHAMYQGCFIFYCSPGGRRNFYDPPTFFFKFSKVFDHPHIFST